MRALVAGYPNEAERCGGKAAFIPCYLSGAPCGSKKTPLAAENLQRRPAVRIRTGGSADHCIFHSAALEHRADGATMTTQNTSPADSVLDYRRLPVRDKTNTERDIFFR